MKTKFNVKRILTVTCATLALSSLVVGQIAPVWNEIKGDAAGTSGVLSNVKNVTGDVSIDLSSYIDSSVMYKLPDAVGDSQEISVIVKHSAESLLDAYSKKGKTVASMGEFVLSAEGKQIVRTIEYENSKLRSVIEKAGISYKPGGVYDTVLSGFEVVIRAKDFAKLSSVLGDSATTIISEEYKPCETQLVENKVKVYETGIFDSSDSDYDGSGVVIAVLDAGLDYTHSAFSNDRFAPHEGADELTKEEIALVLGDMEASQLVDGLTAEDVYMTRKIPYAFDYADNDADVAPINSEHGTHVSGIIVGNDDTIYGVAPNAQLAFMKVFSDIQTGAKQSWILSAIEDCVKLEVDVINMSLGMSSGFSRESDKAYYNDTYNKVREHGISLVAAASNDQNSTFGSEKNGNLGLTSNPDSGTVGSPSVYEAALSVASISGVKTPYLEYNGKIVYFTDGSDAGAKKKNFVEDILEAGENEREFEYVTVPGIGRSADYQRVDVTGKIALVLRGSTSFEEKARVAKNKGAAGIIIYNNVSGDISMNVGMVDIAVCSISQDDGQLLAAQSSGKIKISRDQVAGPFMSDFSSWGPTPDLRIKPEITAHGGDILSAIPGGGYDRLSGTSMASPNQAGVTALVRQYVKEHFPEIAENAPAVMARVNQLLMSTADIAYNKINLPYAVRKQGAGLANLESATHSPAYLTTFDENGDVMDKTKIELGDDKEKSGVYTMTVGLNNTSSSSLTYDVGARVLTEGVSETLTHQGDTTVTQDGYELKGAQVEVLSVDGQLASGNSVTVSGNSSVNVTVQITLSEEDKKYLDESFENGMYVEGFVTFTATSGTTYNLNAPYLAFYGDWTQAPIFDKDYFETNKDELDDSIDILDKTLPDAYATRAVGGLYDDYINYLGGFYFVQDPTSSAISADRKYVSLSNQEQSVNSIYAIWAGFLRGAKKVEWSIIDSATGEVIERKEELDVRKSYNYGGAIRQASIDVDFKVADYDLKNNSQYLFRAVAYLDYGDGGIDTNKRNVFEFPFVTDFQAPVVTGTKFYTEYDRTTKKTRLFVDLDVFDNHYSMAAVIGNITGDIDSGYEFEGFDKYVTTIYSPFNNTTTITYELTDYIDAIKNSHDGNSIIVGLYDYAMNEAMYEIDIPNEIKSIYFAEGEEGVTLSPYETYKLKTLVYPLTEWAEMLDYESSDEDVVRIVNGTLVAVAPGTATITATSPKYNSSATLSVTVLDEDDDGYIRYDKPVAEAFRLTGYTTNKAFYMIASSDRDIGNEGSNNMTGTAQTFNLSMYPSESVTVNYKLDAFFPEDTEVRFESSDATIATVTAKGKIVAVEEGETSITVSVCMDGLSTYYSQTIGITVKNPYERNGPYLLAYRGNGGVVEIPSDMALTDISMYAFSGYQYIPKDENDEISEEDPSKTKIHYVGEHTITKVIIPEGVKLIDEFAFANLTRLEEVVLPSTLRTINEGAFINCRSLRTVTGLEHVQFINMDAFKNCAISSVKLDNVVAIGNSAFENNSLTVVTLPETAQSLGARAFAENENLYMLDIKAPLVKFGPEAFVNCESLEDVTVNAAVIPNGLFDGCEALKTITLGKDVSVINTYAFRNTQIEQFTVASGNSAYKTGANGAFLLNAAGNTIALVAPVQKNEVFAPANASAITAVGENAFSGVKTVKEINLPNVMKVAKYAFADCTALEKLTLGALTEIGEYAFYATAINTLPSIAGVQNIGAYAFNGTNIKQATIADGTNVGVYAFANCNSLTTVNVGKNVILGEGAFFIPYDEKTFVFDSALTSVTINEKTEIGNMAFHGAVLLPKVALVGEGITIGDAAFYNNVSLTQINLEKVTQIGAGAFYGLTLNRIDENGNVVEFVPNSAPLVSINLSACETIGDLAFAYCIKLTSVKMGENLSQISDGTFYGCEKLTSVDFTNVTEIGASAFYGAALKNADLSTVSTIEDLAFAYNKALTTVTFSENVTVGDGAFLFCDTLATINNLGYVTEIGANAFRGTQVASVDLTSAKKVGDFAFMNAPVTQVTFGEQIEEMGDNPFAGCPLPLFTAEVEEEFNGTTYKTTTDTFAIGEKVQVIDGALYRVVPNGYEFVTYPMMSEEGSFTVAEGTVRIGALAFYDTALYSVELPVSLKSIGDKAFFDCEKLSVVTFKSLQAPALEEQFDINYTLYTNLPTTGVYPGTEFEGLGITEYYIWNPNISIFYFGANFVNYIGHKTTPLVMVYPHNGTNYDSYIYGQYFTASVEGKTAPSETTLAAIDAINAIPDYVTLEAEDVIVAARAAYDKIATTEQQALVTNYGKLTAAERTLEYLKPDVDPEVKPDVDPVPDEGTDNSAVIVVLSILTGVFGVATVAGAVFFVLKRKQLFAKTEESAEESSQDSEE